jgi:hypothetical protein
VNVVGIIDVQQKMFSAYFEGYIVSMYGFVVVSRNGFKYIHCGLLNLIKYLIITLTIGSNFVFIFSLNLNVQGPTFGCLILG